MLYTITKITTEKVEFSNEFETISVPKRTIDLFAYLTVGKEIELEDGKIPYSISARRRADIRAHHAEEARNGNL